MVGSENCTGPIMPIASRSTQSELLERLNAIRVDLTAPQLPDDFGRAEPNDISSELGGNMQRQIELVDGGFPRIKRAARERWRQETSATDGWVKAWRTRTNWTRMTKC